MKRFRCLAVLLIVCRRRRRLTVPFPYFISVCGGDIVVTILVGSDYYYDNPAYEYVYESDRRRRWLSIEYNLSSRWNK